ncbi:hypothetical protein D3C81_2194610 [compost metagenome]
MGFVDDDQIPPSTFQIMPILAITLQGINRDDGAVVIVEGVVVSGNVAPNSLNSS